MHPRLLICLMALASLMATTAATGQSSQDPVGDLLRTRASSSPPPIQDEEARTLALNSAILEHNQAADQQDRANTQNHADAMARFESQSAEVRQAQASYEAQLKANMETYAQAQARHEQAMSDWRATVAACKAGNTARCQAGHLPPAPSN